jgi:phosphatidylglycerophosphate synthase
MAVRNESIRDALTVPNAITLGRLATSPFLAWQYAKDAKRWAPVVAIDALSDNGDGFLARLGEKYPKLAKFGFRTSELGRKADPFTDKFFGGQILLANFVNGVFDTPGRRTVGAASVAQKLVVGVQTWNREQHGVELEVGLPGKLIEFVTNSGFGTMMLAERIEDPEKREQRKTQGAMLAAIGVAAATVQTIRYAHQAGSITGQQPRQ